MIVYQIATLVDNENNFEGFEHVEIFISRDLHIPGVCDRSKGRIVNGIDTVEELQWGNLLGCHMQQQNIQETVKETDGSLSSQLQYTAWKLGP